MKKHTWKIVFGIAIVLLGGSIVFSQNVANKANEGIVIGSHIKGNPDAEVVLLEYSDFQCPACAQFNIFVSEIMDKHGSKIRFEYKHFPLISIHPFAIPAARAAEAAGQQGKFFEMHDLLFENQSVWANSPAAQSYFSQYAEEIGLDMSLFKRHTNSSLINDAIEDSFREAQSLGITSTPTFYLNGEKMSFETFDDFTAQIEVAIGVVPDSADDVSSEHATESSVEFGITQ